MLLARACRCEGSSLVFAPYPECVLCGRLPKPETGGGEFVGGLALLDAVVERQRERSRPRWRAEAERRGMSYADYLRVTAAPGSEASGESRRAPGRRVSEPKSQRLRADAPPGSLAAEADEMGLEADAYAALVALA